MSLSLKEQILAAAEAIRSCTSREFDIGIILGTGLGDLADRIESPVVIPYEDIPHFPESTVAFHAGRLVCGELAGRSVLVMQGRFHYYEGYAMSHITLPIRVMSELGIESLLITNAAGGIVPDLTPGSVSLIRDHINLMGDNPLIGPHEPYLGERFPDMSDPYDPEYRSLVQEVAGELDIPVRETVYAAISGPTFETPAEIRMLQLCGAESVGMSVIPEVLVARQLKMRVLALSIITDQSLPTEMQPISHKEVSQVAKIVGPTLQKLVIHLLERIDL